MKREHQELLRRLALNDEGALTALLGTSLAATGPGGLDARTAALVRLAALVALESASASYQWCVAGALAAGATDDEVVDVLSVLAPVVGAPRVSSAAPEVALAIGCDLGMPPEPSGA
ncbi:MAG: carboxymuconolactone decarboxylase family protein [Thermoanaerobacterales bacterium]|nr:carboxymuconolactone decarboxylase family protein [Thermoanaerobacterales bacterium]